MSNLVKSRNIVCNQNEKKVIDYNDLISAKIMKIREAIEQESRDKKLDFVAGINADTAIELLDEENENVEKVDLESVNREAERIIDRANEDARAIVERAKQEADMIRSDNARIGREEGYEEGRTQAETEFADLKRQVEEERLQMELDYNDRVNEIEPLLVDTILQVFEKVTHVLAEDKKDLVLNLVNDVLNKTEVSKEFLIRVSAEDYQFMQDNRDRINGVASEQVQIDIVEDHTFRKGQCMIESDSGIYDCSLDIQLDNLISAIKLMTCLADD